MIISEEDALQHFGIRGMKWGKHKTESSGKSAPKQSRKEFRALNKQGAKDFYEAKAKMILEEAAARPDNVLVKIRLPGDTYPTVATGRQVVDHLSAGGAFDIKQSNIWARKENNDDPWELDPNYNKNMVYAPIKRNK